MTRRLPFSPLHLYNSHFLWFDVAVPIVIGGGIVYTLDASFGADALQASIKDHRATTYAAVVGTAATLCGFSMTLMLLTRAVLTQDTLRALHGSARVMDLFRAIVHAIVALGMLTVSAFVAILTDTETAPREVVPYLIIVLFVLAAWKLGSVIRVVWLLLKAESRAARNALQAEAGLSPPHPPEAG